MKNYKKSQLIMVAAVLLITVLFASVSFASEEAYRKSQAADMGQKLGRGFLNILTGWIEIPKNIARVSRETDPFSGAVVGFIQGVGWAWGRTISGVYDVFTFPLPIPKDYEPLMDPEYILPELWGEPLPMMDNLEDQE